MNQHYEPVPERAEATGRTVVDAALAVHRALGPGLLESAYEACLAWELERRGCAVARQRILPLRYEEVEIEAGYRLDLLVNDAVIVETKAVEMLGALHEAQLLTYLRLSGLRLGFLINFNVPLVKQGMKRMVL
ncbi:GxxExxY protein [Aquibaculum arenosum]|uniref:GxxExxY protein n=1 Tax=Aquibaculum arenosum TaxID=3032591 RepID=A0ABT5YRC1_9PROT|nr:GxxExxY protein [Fodinicurvata sp. CAU 1616]MDF2097432.1 GxxExxY protein [Fodinicurvata sp. CAU 1616]